jgi:hypothetical protein
LKLSGWFFELSGEKPERALGSSLSEPVTVEKTGQKQSFESIVSTARFTNCTRSALETGKATLG